MGCWNETCYMSNLPILWGDKIALIVLGPTSIQKISENCYPEDNYVPLGFPIIGEYDDYGGIENAVINPYMEQYLQTFAKLYHKKTGCDFYNPEYEDYQWVSFEKFLGDLCRHSLYVDAVMSNKKQELEFVMIHYNLYQQLLTDMANRIPYNKTETLQVLLKNKVLSAIKECDDAKKYYVSINLPKHLWVMSDTFSEKCKYSNDYRWKSLDKMIDYYQNTFDETIIDDSVNHMLWYKVMLYSRKGYHCYSGGGGQSQEYQIHKIIANFILNKCEERRHDEDEGYQDESVLSETIFF